MADFYFPSLIKLPDDDLQGLPAAVLDGHHDGGAALAALLVHQDVRVFEQVEDGPGHVEPAGGVESGEAVLVAEVDLHAGVGQEVLPDLGVIVANSPPQSPASLHVHIHVVVQG